MSRLERCPATTKPKIVIRDITNPASPVQRDYRRWFFLGETPVSPARWGLAYAFMTLFPKTDHWAV